METRTLEEMAQTILTLIQTDSSIKDEKTVKYNCKKCNDFGYILDAETDTAKECECNKVRIYKKKLKESGISEAFSNKKLDNYIEKDESTKMAKNMAIDYINNFEEIFESKHNSVAFLGQSGAGKTHLSIAIANELMRRGIGVLYISYREEITHLKQIVNDGESYRKNIEEYKEAEVLLIDALYKGAIQGNGPGKKFLNPSDERIMYEIIDHRYFTNAPIIFSGEFLIKELLQFSEALNSRIIEMCKGHIVEFEGRKLNNRLV